MDVLDYQAAIAPLLTDFENNNLDDESSGELADLLGCPYVVSDSDHERSLRTPGQPAAICEPVAHATLMHMLRCRHTERRPVFNGSDHILISGLSRGTRWASCLTNNADAYAFATLIFQFYSGMEKTFALTFADELHRDTVQVCVNDMLRQWLRPKDPDLILTSRAFASAAFGEPWCVFMLDGEYAVGNIINITQPPFAADLVAYEGAPEEVPALPEMSA